MAETVGTEWWNNHADYGEEPEDDDLDEADNIRQYPEQGVGDEARNAIPEVAGPNRNGDNFVHILQRQEDRRHLQIAEKLQMIANDIDHYYKNPISRFVESGPEAWQEQHSLRNVVRVIFEGYPQICWEQMGLMFYAGTRVVSASRMFERVTWRRIVLEGVTEQTSRYAGQQIQRLGGWPAVGEYCKTTTGQAWLVFAAGAASAYLVYKKYAL